MKKDIMIAEHDRIVQLDRQGSTAAEVEATLLLAHVMNDAIGVLFKIAHALEYLASKE